nr:MAG TPA: hypothetical protein [Caudoviricetes sp.]DAZ70835.1 MAG TPA: hypothetical protein [Caudoviricetes sp.]
MGKAFLIHIFYPTVKIYLTSLAFAYLFLARFLCT